MPGPVHAAHPSPARAGIHDIVLLVYFCGGEGGGGGEGVGFGGRVGFTFSYSI